MIRYGVVHHPSRAGLLKQFDGLDPVVYVDPDPEGKPNPWRTYRYALERFPAGASHLVLMQDDSEPVPGFAAAIERAVAARPDDPIVLCVTAQANVNARRLIAACAADEPFFTCDPQQWIPVVGIIWPADRARDFLEWAEQAGYGEDGRRRRADDWIVGEWQKKRGVKIIGTVPNLLEHPDEVDSLINMKNRIPRRSVCLARTGDDFCP